MTLLFYDLSNSASDLASPPSEGLHIRFWQPATDGLPPRELRSRSFFLFWALDKLGVFARRDLTVLEVFEQDQLVHYLMITPKWRRYPTMAAGDLQIGNLWTAPAHRGRGLAGIAMRAALARCAGQFEKMWYICDEQNAPSRRLAEKSGFRLVGRGRRTAPHGIRMLGQFVIDGSGA